MGSQGKNGGGGGKSGSQFGGNGSGAGSNFGGINSLSMGGNPFGGPGSGAGSNFPGLNNMQMGGSPFGGYGGTNFAVPSGMPTPLSPPMFSPFTGVGNAPSQPISQPMVSPFIGGGASPQGAASGGTAVDPGRQQYSFGPGGSISVMPGGRQPPGPPTMPGGNIGGKNGGGGYSPAAGLQQLMPLLMQMGIIPQGGQQGLFQPPLNVPGAPPPPSPTPAPPPPPAPPGPFPVPQPGYGSGLGVTGSAFNNLNPDQQNIQAALNFQAMNPGQPNPFGDYLNSPAGRQAQAQAQYNTAFGGGNQPPPPNMNMGGGSGGGY